MNEITTEKMKKMPEIKTAAEAAMEDGVDVHTILNEHPVQVALEQDGIDIETIPTDPEWWAAFAKLVDVYVALDPVEQKAALAYAQTLDSGTKEAIAAANDILVANGYAPYIPGEKEEE